jgi:hypothetical protein
VLHSAEGDPLIGDISQPEVPVLWDRHGAGKWSPKPLFPSLQALMERIVVRETDPPLPRDLPPATFYTVRLTDLGPQSLQVLAALKEHPNYKDLAGANLLKLKHQLPLLLLDDSISGMQKDRLVGRFASLGAQVEVIERVAEWPVNPRPARSGGL